MDANCPPALPGTPQRGHSAYPAHLARAGEERRVPLHRRGTSQKLECFEDLLREAGFKETRVFTPEAERVEAAAQARKKQAEKTRGEKRSANGLVGFLSNLVPWSDAEGGPRSSKIRTTKTQSLGRAAGKQNEILLNDDEDGFKNADGSSDALVTPTPPRRRPLTPIVLSPEYSSPGSSSSASSQSPPHLHLQSHFRLTPNDASSMYTVHTRPDARTALRHMMSMPDFVLAQRTSLPSGLSRRVTENAPIGTLRRQPIGNRQHSSKARLQREIETVPPLPQNWLSNVAHAVLGDSGTGARIGRPQAASRVNGNRQTQLLKSSSQPVSDARYSTEYTRRDGRLTRRGFAPVTSRVDTTHGVVTPASVVCRSAPGSRSSSLMRKRSVDTHARGRPQTREWNTCLPSLGVTDVELARSSSLGNEVDSEQNDGDVARASTEDANSSYGDDSSDEGELDFARLIVPARRQHSIHSLRRHLHNHAVASGGANAPPSAYTAYDRTLKRPASYNSVRGRTRTSSNQADSLVKSSIMFNDPDDLNHLLRGRRASTEEDAEDGLSPEWAAHGLPGLENVARKRRGALPWASR